MTHTIDLVDACLPQTQCTQCGYPRCRLYAEAVAHGTATIDRCPPGGETTIAALARLLNLPIVPLDTHYGEHRARRRAVIDEAVCIGCRKCIDACPVDAIVGARKLMHTVLASTCSGCELCVAPCPVDCIHLLPAPVPATPGPWPEYSEAETRAWRVRAHARVARLTPSPAPTAGAAVAAGDPGAAEKRKAEIRAAVERVRRRRDEEK